jgi:hypothetical protein
MVSRGSTVATRSQAAMRCSFRLVSNPQRVFGLGRPGVPFGEHIRQFAQGESDREEALGCNAVLAVARLSALIGSERVQLVLARPLPQHVGGGQRGASRVLRAVSSSSFRRSGAGIADSGNAGSNPAGGMIPRVCADTLFVSGRLAQLGEHLPYKQGVAGSSPAPPTFRKPR